MDTLVLGSVLALIGIPFSFEIGGIMALVTELLCFLTHYGNDRIWNKIQWGRKVFDIKS